MRATKRWDLSRRLCCKSNTFTSHLYVHEPAISLKYCAVWNLFFPAKLKSECYVRSQCNNRKKNRANKQPPWLLLNGWHFHVSNMKKTIKCQNVWPPKCLLWYCQPLYSSMQEYFRGHMPTSRTVFSGVSEWYFGYDFAPTPLWWWIVSEYVDFGEHWCC